MRAETANLLENLSKDFEEKGGGKPKRKGHGVIDHRKFIELRGSGMPLADAVRGAGSTMTSRKALQVLGTNMMKTHPEYVPAVLDILREKQRMLLNAMTKEKMENASLSAIAVTTGIVTDKIQLLSGQPTERTDSLVNFEEMDKARLTGFILGRLSAGQPKSK